MSIWREIYRDLQRGDRLAWAMAVLFALFLLSAGYLWAVLPPDEKTGWAVGVVSVSLITGAIGYVQR